MSSGYGLQALQVVDTIRRRMDRSESLADPANNMPDLDSAPPTDISTSISHAHFAALSSRLAQVAAKASADAMAMPVHAQLRASDQV